MNQSANTLSTTLSPWRVVLDCDPSRVAISFKTKVYFLLALHRGATDGVTNIFLHATKIEFVVASGTSGRISASNEEKIERNGHELHIYSEFVRVEVPHLEWDQYFNYHIDFI